PLSNSPPHSPLFSSRHSNSSTLLLILLLFFSHSFLLLYLSVCLISFSAFLYLYLPPLSSVPLSLSLPLSLSTLSVLSGHLYIVPTAPLRLSHPPPNCWWFSLPP